MIVHFNISRNPRNHNTRPPEILQRSNSTRLLANGVSKYVDKGAIGRADLDRHGGIPCGITKLHLGGTIHANP